MNLKQIEEQLQTLLSEFEQQVTFRNGQIFVVGCSTSEVKGEKIGTAGGLEIAEALYKPLKAFADKHEIYLAFQGCEHLNRALTIERAVAEQYRLEPVSVIPVRTAGGSMSTYAYSQFNDPVVVEEIVAHAGIDIGQTLIGMHLKKVAVPVRTSISHIGDAVVTVAKTRPKLIGGERAIYNKE
ncbi:TIGR01440 family protein [Rummeliibacillus sp. NPDC094406]|uniref:TIGR01440 family protein n=1 Tax=Rummeliibacillus sp. NPDC094406 TaxID=3364511 RepID=UPI00382DD08C